MNIPQDNRSFVTGSVIFITPQDTFVNYNTTPEAVQHESPEISALQKRTKLSAKGKSPYGPQRNK